MATLSVDGVSARAWEREQVRVDPTARIVGQSAAIQSIRELIAAVAGNHCTVLITGESGVGKKLIARTIHEMSDRADQPFIEASCSQLPDALSVFRAARGGTVFLDEVAELTPALQVKLERVLQDRESAPVGDSDKAPFDVRIIAASKHSLSRNGQQTLRDDLYYQLSVVQLQVAPLRDRREDIGLLTDYFNARHATAYGQSELVMPPDVLGKMADYHWPGNVRELSNVMERWYALGRLPAFDPSPACNPPTRSPADEKVPTWEEAERQLIIRALGATDGSKVGAARLLEIERHRLYRKIRKYKIAAKN